MSRSTSASTKGTSSQTLLLLERKGLLERRRDERDGRVVRLALTDEGHEVVRATSTLAAGAAVEGVGDPEALSATLTELLATAQRANGLRSFGVCQSCDFFRLEAPGYRCGLTGEPLSAIERTLICREHQIGSEASDKE